ncbi:hypothetical protein NL676_039843 [Syzygium grande]|nr:hypothetical protein NL676_039843 [Syzygium grande]
MASGGSHGNAVDCWALRIFIYEMVYGCTPFTDTSNEVTLCNIVRSPSPSPTPLCPPRPMSSTPATSSPGCYARTPPVEARSSWAAVGASGPGEGEGLLDDVMERDLIQRIGEGRAAIDHLVDEDPKSPLVNGIAMGPVGGHLLRHVLVNPDEGMGPGADWLGLEYSIARGEVLVLAQSEGLVEAGKTGEQQRGRRDCLRTQVPVDDPKHVESVSKERVAHHLEDPPLHLHPLALLLLLRRLLVNHFHRVKWLSVVGGPVAATEVDGANGAGSYAVEEPVVTESKPRAAANHGGGGSIGHGNGGGLVGLDGGGRAMAVVVVELPSIEREAAKGVVAAAKAALTIRVKRLLHNP